MNKTKYLLLLILIAISFLVFYKYNYKTSQFQTVDYTNDIVNTATTTPIIEYSVEIINSGIILKETGIYKDLNQEGKKIVDDQFKSTGTDIKYLEEMHNSSFLKYYDKRIAIIGEYGMKPTLPLIFFDRKNMKNIADPNTKLYARPLNYFEGYTEKKQYMISAYDDGIVYYKAGNYNLKLLPNSALREGETYSKTNEMVNKYELYISTGTPAVLKATVFSNTEYDGDYHKKLREVEYVLP